jgi:hypothetical protein
MSKRDEEAREREKREREKREHRRGDRRERESNSGGHGEGELENDEGNRAHIEIEERRFRGGLSPTPELYARARQQWSRLPGSVVRPAEDPQAGKPRDDSEVKAPGAGGGKDEKEGSR